MKKHQTKEENKEGASKKFILLALAFAFFVIGIHQSITVGFEYSYWIFMLSISLVFLHRYKSQKEGSQHKNGK
jgi:hypothetical protein